MPNKNYQYQKGKWVVCGYSCEGCYVTRKTENDILNHEKNCPNINTNKKDVTMPIQRIMKNGEAYYRYGQTGKLYKTREEAEEQRKAMYASGYKKKKD